MNVDTLSDVLRAVRLTGAVFFDVTACPPWCAEAPPSREIVAAVMPSAGHLIEFHVVTRGRCWAGLLGDAPVRLEAGDVIAFPQGDPHVMSSAPGLRAPHSAEVYHEHPDQFLPFRLRLGPEGPESTHVVCGFLGCEARPFNPLLGTLPRQLLVRGADGPGGDWVGHFIQYAVAESGARRAGSDAVLARLSELMFVDLVRRHLATLPEDQTGWLAGLRDPAVGRALAALHERPGDSWSVDELARAAALSRSAFFDRFVHFVGLPPMQYLAQWRMQLAAGRLSGSADSIATVAAAVGYDSEAAFSRAFKKLVGVPPSEWRKRKVAGAPTAKD
jgi:AraC-like DNA-binding protein